jgi:hypothetical protein
MASTLRVPALIYFLISPKYCSGTEKDTKTALKKELHGNSFLQEKEGLDPLILFSPLKFNTWGMKTGVIVINNVKLWNSDIRIEDSYGTTMDSLGVMWMN